MTAFTESTVEAAALAWLESSGWRVAHGPGIAPGPVCVRTRTGRHAPGRAAKGSARHSRSPRLALGRRGTWRSAEMDSGVQPT